MARDSEPMIPTLGNTMEKRNSVINDKTRRQKTELAAIEEGRALPSSPFYLQKTAKRIAHYRRVSAGSESWKDGR